MKTRRIAALCMCAVMTASLAACGGSGDKGASEGGKDKGGKLSVMIWDNYQEPGLKEIIADFTEETGIEAELQVVQWNEYWTLLEAGAQGGEMPDVFWMHSNESQRYMSNEILLDLTDRASDSELVDMSKYPEEIKELYTYDGKVYGIPKGYVTISGKETDGERHHEKYIQIVHAPYRPAAGPVAPVLPCRLRQGPRAGRRPGERRFDSDRFGCFRVGHPCFHEVLRK